MYLGYALIARQQLKMPLHSRGLLAVVPNLHIISCSCSFSKSYSRSAVLSRKELGKVPGAPHSKKDVFHLCRGFERAFSQLLEVHLLTHAFLSCAKHAMDEMSLEQHMSRQPSDD